MEKRASLGDRLRYAMDNLFSRGTGALIGALAVFSLAIVSIAAGVLVVTGFSQTDQPPLDFFEAFWEGLMRTFDAGTMGGDTGWGFRLVMLGVTVGGIFIISTLIGVLTTGVEGKLDELRKGRSRVIEKGHTVILGWTEQVYTIIPELVTANENLARSCIVVMADKDKVEMEDALKQRIGSYGKTRMVCRSGSPMEMADLEILNLDAARAIIVLSPEEEPDSSVIKTILAITNRPGRQHDHPYHIVAGIRVPKNLEVAQVVGKGEVEWIEVGDFIARITAQTCRQSGLSVVYTELMDFGGDEIYFHTEPALAEKTFAEALFAFEKNAVMGVCQAGGVSRLNPPMNTLLKPEDKLIVIAEDDDKIFIAAEKASIQAELISKGAPKPPAPENSLVLGWNWRGPQIIRELNDYVASGSKLLLVADEEGLEETVRQCSQDLKRLGVTLQHGDTTDRRTLDALDLVQFNHIILLCSDKLEPQQADARTLITLLHLRDIAEKAKADFAIVSEMLDIRNRDLAVVTQADDFIVSDKLVSLRMAQVAENKTLNAVFTDLFDPQGSEIYLKPVEDYVHLNTPVNFYTVVEAARRRNEVAIGYRKDEYAHDPASHYGVTINPCKSEPVVFIKGDRVIVLAEE